MQVAGFSTPGHDPHHLCFLDTMSEGLFCGDALGGYFSEIDLVIPPQIPGTDFHGTLKSIEKLGELHPSELFFSHGCAVKNAGEYIQMAVDNLRNSQNTVYDALLAGEDDECKILFLVYGKVVSSNWLGTNHRPCCACQIYPAISL